MEILQEVKQIDIRRVMEDLGFKIQYNRKVLCPFHEEDFPSLVIYPLPQNEYHCFGCGRHGDVINFYAEVNGLDFRTALTRLAYTYIPGFDGGTTKEKPITIPLKIPPKERKDKPQPTFEPAKQTLFSDIYEAFADFCLKQSVTDIAKDAFRYLLDRGIWEKTIREFHLFVIKDYPLVNEYMKSKFVLLDLQESGLYNERGNLVFFKHPFIIPYYKNERIIFLQGRVVGTPPENTNKYQFLSGIPRPIFNLDSLNALKTNRKLYLTEGAIDTMMLVQNGYAALSLGSASTFRKEWAKLMRRFEVVVCFDNDETGQKSGKELEKKLTEAGITVAENDVLMRKISEMGAKDISEYFLKR